MTSTPLPESKPVLYFLTGNPPIYGVYNTFFELLSVHYHVVLVCYPSISPALYTSWLRSQVFSQWKTLPLTSTRSSTENPESEIRFCDVVDGRGRYHRRLSCDLREESVEKFSPSKAILLCHSYGAWHGVRLQEDLKFKQLVLVGPYLMQGDDSSGTRRLLQTLTNSWVRSAVLNAHTFLHFSLPDVWGLWQRFFGVDRAMLNSDVGSQIFDICAWELSTIDPIRNFDDSYEFLEAKSSVVDPEETKVVIDTSKTILIYPIEPRDAWCHRTIFEKWPEQKKHALKISHNFVSDPKHTKILVEMLVVELRKCDTS